MVGVGVTLEVSLGVKVGRAAHGKDVVQALHEPKAVVSA